MLSDSLSKDQIDRLRHVPLSAVLGRLGYEGPNLRWRNAIDAVKDLGSCDYQQAVAWLAHEFVTEIADHSAGEGGKTEPPRRFTRQEYAVRCELGKQLDGLGAASYRVTMMHPDLPSYNLGKGEGENDSECFYRRDESIAQMKADGLAPNVVVQTSDASIQAAGGSPAPAPCVAKTTSHRERRQKGVDAASGAMYVCYGRLIVRRCWSWGRRGGD